MKGKGKRGGGKGEGREKRKEERISVCERTEMMKDKKIKGRKRKNIEE